MAKFYKISITILFILFLIDSDAQVCNYKFRKRIKIDHTKVGGSTDLVDFPVLINLATDNDLRTVANSGKMQNVNGYDTYFTASDGITALDFQLETYTATSGQLIAWVRIPSLSVSVDTYIYLYYGNASISTNPSVATTWDNNFKGIWHLDEDPTSSAPQIKESTSNNNSGTTLNMIAGDNVTGLIGKAINFDGSSKYITLGATGFPNIDGVQTISSWANYSTVVTSDNENFLSISSGGGGANQIGFRGGIPLAWQWGGGGLASGPTAPSVNVWHHFVYTYDGTTHSYYIDGALVGTSNNTPQTGAPVAGQVSFGTYMNGGSSPGGEYYNGYLDEGRVSNINRSAGWVLTEYNNQGSPSTFYSITAAPDVWIGGTSTAWSTASNWASGTVPATGDDIIITNGTHQPQMSAAFQASSLFIQPGATLNLSNRTLSIYFDITNCGMITGSTGTININGNASYIQTQYLSGTGTYNLTNLTVNNTFGTAPALKLSSPVSVSGALTLTSAVVYTTNANILNLTSAATSTSGSATSYVSGPMTKAGNTAFVFPVGKGGVWRRIAITPSATATFRAEYFNYPYTTLTPATAPLDHVSSLEYWQLDETSGTANASMTLYWENAATSGINNCANLKIGRWNGSSWNNVTSSTTGTCTGTGSGTVASTAVVASASFNRPFTFGSTSAGNIDPLPVSWLDFTATGIDNKKVNVNWSTATEINNEGFTIERSADGKNFTALAFIAGAGNSNSIRDYSFIDEHPLSGISYYRIMQTDVNKNYTFSNTESVVMNALDLTFNVFPNPSSGELYLSNILSGEEIQINLYDMSGRVILSKSVSGSGEKDVVTILDAGSNIGKGIYLITISSNSKALQRKVVLN